MTVDIHHIAVSPAPASLYGLSRDEPQGHRGGGWWMAVRRQGRAIRRLFKDSIYGSPDAALMEAARYRDAILAVLPPRTNRQQAMRLRRNNTSGVSGLRRAQDKYGPFWQATLLTRDEDGVARQKTRRFSVRRHGEEEARQAALTQRLVWLTELEPAFLAYDPCARQSALSHFPEKLDGTSSTAPAAMTPDEIAALIAPIDARFDARQPRKIKGRGIFERILVSTP